jgi:hypothetical protein
MTHWSTGWSFTSWSPRHAEHWQAGRRPLRPTAHSRVVIGSPPLTVGGGRWAATSPRLRSRIATAGEDARAYSDRVKYLEEVRSLWRTSVPRSGQAATVHGELLRAVEKLRDEAQRNGNINWDTGHEILIAYLRDNLPGSALFDKTAGQEIKTDLDSLSTFEYPDTSDAPYDRLADRVIERRRAHPEPVAHTRNPDLHR